MANFSSVPTIRIPRSKFDLSFSRKMSASVGKLYPCYLQEVYPGDTFECDATFVARLSSAYIRPVMDDLYLDMYFFFVPNRLVMRDWENMFGSGNPNEWSQNISVTCPVTTSSEDVVLQSVADYLGIPLADAGDGTYLPKGINLLPFRGFAKIYNEWFRDENLIAPMNISNSNSQGVLERFNHNAWSSANYTGMLPNVAKFHDYFTSCTPSPQKGLPVDIPFSGNAPLKADGVPYSLGSKVVLYPADSSGAPVSAVEGTNGMLLGSQGPISAGDGVGNLHAYASAAAPVTTGIDAWATNLRADLAAINASVNDLRMAFQIQRILERSATGGSRYVEYILSAFGVRSPDARLQRPEYLGGKRFPLAVQQVAQTVRDNNAETLGSLGAFSLSNGRCGYTKGFVEHGFIFGVMCIRQRHSYPQGLERFWSRSSRFDYYDPLLAHIGEQPVYKDEIYALKSTSGVIINGSPFGYQEAWADLRYRPNQICGQMRSEANPSLDIWHFGDDYSNAPTLNQQWIEETPDFVNRTIAVPSTSLDQFIFDIHYRNIATRCLPTYSTPAGFTN